MKIKIFIFLTCLLSSLTIHSQMSTFDPNHITFNSTEFNELSPESINQQYLDLVESTYYLEMDDKYVTRYKNENIEFYFENNYLIGIEISFSDSKTKINNIGIGDDISLVLNSFENSETYCANQCWVTVYNSSNLSLRLIYTYNKSTHKIIQILYTQE